MKSKMRASNGRARRLAVLYLALLVAAAPFYQASARDSSSQASLNALDVSPLDSRQEIGPIEPEDVWIDAFNMSACGKAEFRAWQKEESAFGCTGHAHEFEQQDASERGNIAPRIVGGEFAQEGEFPSFVHIRITRGDEKFLCGATLINKNLVVTAAHCVEDSSNSLLIFGTNFFNGIGGEVRQADRWCYPSKFVRAQNGHDLAIIRFKEDIEYTDKIWPACLNLDSRPSEETTCAIAGLGRVVNSFDGPAADQLKTLRVKRSCQVKHYSNSCYMTVGAIDDGLQKAHNGDSGSPIICYDRCGLDSSNRVKAFAVGAHSWTNKSEDINPEPTLELLGNHGADFHQLRPNFLELLQAIRREGEEITDSVKCLVPS